MQMQKWNENADRVRPFSVFGNTYSFTYSFWVVLQKLWFFSIFNVVI